MIAEMLKVQITGLKSQKQEIISLLHNLGTLHIELTPIPKALQPGLTHVLLEEKEQQESSLIEETLKKIKEILPYLRAVCNEDINKIYRQLEEKTILEIQTKVFEIEQRVKSLLEEKDRLNAQMIIQSQYKKIVEAFLQTKYDFSKYENLEGIALVFPKKFVKRLRDFQELIEKKIRHKTDIYLSDFDAKRVVSLIFYEKRFSKDIDEEIFKRGTQKFALPQEYFVHPFKKSVKLIEEKLKNIGERIANCDQKIETLAKQNFCFLHAVKLLLEDRINELVLQQNFVISKYTITITGWLPKERFEETKNILEKEFGNKIIFQDITKSVKHREEIPILLENLQAIKPFELFLSFLQPPKYGTFDPTKFLAIFFPIFFGLIVGDLGYGLILLILSLFLKRLKRPILRTISKLISYVSLLSIVFGLLFGEFFGELGTKFFGLNPILFHRQKDIIPFLILVISLGLFHILLGLVLGFIQALRQKQRREILERFSLILSLFGLFFLLAVLSKTLPKGFSTPSIALLVVSLPLLILAKGFLGPLETVSCLANILSYARIMALGIAGVMMAHVANTLGGMLPNVILGIIVASLMHILNLILSLFSPTIQSLRLHYVEFFSKFYEPGGKKYRPFKRGGESLCIP
ncbi:MAG: hypothetical protein NC821_02315 [Candidatus Omnitrophica bacterium]|nr:hypothetical protein [Candidatus Omnitrophota bacterium]